MYQQLCPSKPVTLLIIIHEKYMKSKPFYEKNYFFLTLLLKIIFFVKILVEMGCFFTIFYIFHIHFILLLYVKKDIKKILATSYFSYSLSSAFRCLTSVFGMGTGEPPSNYHQYIFSSLFHFFKFSENKIMCSSNYLGLIIWD